MSVMLFLAACVQKIAMDYNAKAVVLHGNSYRFAQQRLLVCGVKR